MSITHRVEEYIEGVQAGTVPAGRYVRLAVRRHLEDLEHAEQRGYVFSPPHAELACDWIETRLRHSKGEWAGRRFELSPSQAFINWVLLGWRRKADMLRRFNRAYVTCARKWGKSTWASTLSLLLGTYDEPNEPGAEIYLVATKEQQVMDTTFRECMRMAEQSEGLRARVQQFQKAIVVHGNDKWQPNSFIKPIGSDSATSDGYNTHGAILDELHAWRPRHQELYDKMTTAGGSRRQELIAIITTAGNDESDLWKRLDDFYVKILDGVETGDIVSDNHFAFIARLDSEDDIFAIDPDSSEFDTMIAKANPNYPMTPKKLYIRQQWNEAKDDPIERQKFLRFHGNVAVESYTKPITSVEWQQAERTVSMTGRCFGGFDLGQIEDFSAWAIVSKTDDDKYELIARTYTCAGRPKALRTAQVADWIRRGYLIEHPGDTVDLTQVKSDIVTASSKYRVEQWAFDRSYAGYMALELERDLGEDALQKFLQTPAMYNEPIRRMFKAIREGSMHVHDNPCTRWQAGNLRVTPNMRGELRPDKGSREYKIDAIVAALMAFHLAMYAAPKPKSRPYSGSGAGVFA